jgi:predicted metal-dependent hydrolase
MLPFNDDPDIKRIIEGFVRQEQHHEETLLTLQSTLPDARRTSSATRHSQGSAQLREQLREHRRRKPVEQSRIGYTCAPLELLRAE